MHLPSTFLYLGALSLSPTIVSALQRYPSPGLYARKAGSMERQSAAGSGWGNMSVSAFDRFETKIILRIRRRMDSISIYPNSVSHEPLNTILLHLG